MGYGLKSEGSICHLYNGGSNTFLPVWLEGDVNTCMEQCLAHRQEGCWVYTNSLCLKDPWGGVGGRGLCWVPRSSHCNGIQVRKELEKTGVWIPPAPCHVPLPGKETGLLEKEKTQKASWASNSSWEAEAFGQTSLNQQHLDPVSIESFASWRAKGCGPGKAASRG